MAADQALLSDIEERKRLYTFKYHDLPENQSPVPASTITSEPAATTTPIPATATTHQKPAKQPAKQPAKRRQTTAAEKGSKKPKVSAAKSTKKALSQPAPKYTEVKSTPPLTFEKPKSDNLADPFAFDEPGKDYTNNHHSKS